MKRLYVAPDPATAHALRIALEAEDIAAVVSGEHAFNAPLMLGTAPTVWVVDDGDYERALQILTDLLEGDAQPPTSPAE